MTVVNFRGLPPVFTHCMILYFTQVCRRWTYKRKMRQRFPPGDGDQVSAVRCLLEASVQRPVMAVPSYSTFFLLHLDSSSSKLALECFYSPRCTSSVIKMVIWTEPKAFTNCSLMLRKKKLPAYQMLSLLSMAMQVMTARIPSAAIAAEKGTANPSALDSSVRILLDKTNLRTKAPPSLRRQNLEQDRPTELLRCLRHLHDVQRLPKPQSTPSLHHFYNEFMREILRPVLKSSIRGLSANIESGFLGASAILSPN